MKLYNSLGQEYQYLELKENSIKIYLCGPTVQSPPHLGHGKSVVSFDILIRYLRSLNQKVTYVRNITDIDDKIIDKAFEENIDFKEISKRNSLIFKETYADLNCLEPDFEPEATKYVGEILNLIDLLVDKGYAYSSPSGVYFSVNKYSRYMELSNRKLGDTVSGERVNLEEDKESKEDFALWLSLAKKQVSLYGLDEPLMFWRKTPNSLSSSIFQKLKDAFQVYYLYEKKNFFYSIYCVIRLSTYAMFKKISSY